MAHPNIDRRRALIKGMVKAGWSFDRELKRSLAKEFGCSVPTITWDINRLLIPKTNETKFINPTVRKEVLNRDSFKCQYCGKTGGNELIIEHVIPVLMGGVGKPYNLVAACDSCNLTKRTEIWVPMNFNVLQKINKSWSEIILYKAVEDFRPS